MIQLLSPEITINGNKPHLIYFTLMIDKDIPYSVCKICLAEQDFNINDSITVSFGYVGQLSEIIFTGYVKDIQQENGNYLYKLLEGNETFWNGLADLAYNDETASNILAEIMTKAGITKKQINCPNITFPQFYDKGKLQFSIERVKKLFPDFSIDDNYYHYFDAEGTFIFGTEPDICKATNYSFKSEENIIKRLDHGFETYLMNIRPFNTIQVDSENHMVNRIIFKARPERNRMQIYTKAVA